MPMSKRARERPASGCVVDHALACPYPRPMRTKPGSYPPPAAAKTARLKEDALREIDRFFKADHAAIAPLTVQEIPDEHIARKLV